jgi:hypothetical protein
LLIVCFKSRDLLGEGSSPNLRSSPDKRMCLCRNKPCDAESGKRRLREDPTENFQY